jgi:DNA processing protein
MIADDELLKHRIALTLLPGVGVINAKMLVSYCGSVEAVFKEKKSSLEKIPGIGTLTAASIIKHEVFERAEEEVKFIRKYKIASLFYLDADYPTRLKNCDDSPVMLYFKGNADLNTQKIIAVVGTRNATEYGKQVCEKLIEGLAAYNISIVSGLAYGIDIISHKLALKNNLPTVGVLAHGLDRIYPGTHTSTAEKMLAHGGLLTEFMSKTNPDHQNFPSRNRVVAGMVDAVIVAESALKGGALITADIAFGYNRDVFAVPGKVNDIYSQGCNHFISENKAALFENAEQFIKAMSWDVEEKKATPNKQMVIFKDLKEEEKVLVELLQENGKLNIDTLILRSKMPVSKVSSSLLNLEFAGVLRSLPGKVYQLN